MKKTLLAIMVMASVFLFSKNANAEVMNQQLGIDDVRSFCKTTQLAQSFTPLVDYVPTSIELMFNQVRSTTTVDVSIKQASTNDRPRKEEGTLFGSIKTLTPTSTLTTFTKFDLSGGYVLKKNVAYSIIISQDGSPDCNTYPHDFIDVRANGNISTGRMYNSADGGETWSNQSVDATYKVNSDTGQLLRFTKPTNNSFVTSPVEFRGTCDPTYPTVDMQFNIIDPFQSATSTTANEDFLVLGMTCTATSSWAQNPLFLSQHRWGVKLTQTGSSQQDIIAFDVYAPKGTVNSTTSDFFIEPGGTPSGSFGFLQNIENNFFAARPFSYIPQIVKAAWDGMDNASTTTSSNEWIPAMALQFPTMNGLATSTWQIPGVSDTSVTTAIPNPMWSTIRGWSTIIVGLSFIWFVWSQRKSLL